jgi:hypothetical protein
MFPFALQGGLREAFRAYSFYVAANGAEPQLPGK